MIPAMALLPLTLVLALQPPALNSTFLKKHLGQWDSIDCPPVTVDNGQAALSDYFADQYIVTVTCKGNYSLMGESVLIGACHNKQWQFKGHSLPRCLLRCPPPPYLENGKLTIDKVPTDRNHEMGYMEGTTVTYACDEGFLVTNPVRKCQNGIWTGANAFCKATSTVTCPAPPEEIPNGFMKSSLDYVILFGDEVMYQCLPGYKMLGGDTLKCTIDGTWSDEVPLCIRNTDFLLSNKCPDEPALESKMVVTSVTDDVAEVDCHPHYRNELSPCQPVKFQCQNGQWEGVYPNCVTAHACQEPPSVHYSQSMNRNFETSYDSTGKAYYPINGQISYECLKGYNLVGSSVITCQSNGCWQPRNLWPKCVRINQETDYFAELNNINAIFVSTATGAGVLGVLLLACLVVACKKRRASARAAPLPPPSVNDHTILLQNPDRLALIAFADGVQNAQNTLPSYDEATRDRSTVIQVSRLQIQRPHWPNLTVCRTNRSRASPQIDHVPRHGSFGSSDTVTISEGSTNVTLDTASSHSAASHSASCRGHCGSLTSFDACSMVNNEGIPLLEENEILEENVGATGPVNSCH